MFLFLDILVTESGSEWFTGDTQMTLFRLGGSDGGESPRTHERSELGHTIIISAMENRESGRSCQSMSHDSLVKETTFKDLYTST